MIYTYRTECFDGAIQVVIFSTSSYAKRKVGHSLTFFLYGNPTHTRVYSSQRTCPLLSLSLRLLELHYLWRVVHKPYTFRKQFWLTYPLFQCRKNYTTFREVQISDLYHVVSLPCVFFLTQKLREIFWTVVFTVHYLKAPIYKFEITT